MVKKLKRLFLNLYQNSNAQMLFLAGGDCMNAIEWVRCPVCGNKTRLQIRADTELKNFPLYCPKCRQESLIDAKDLQVTVIERFEAKMQS